MSEKKVVVVIVEGPSEEAALGSIFKEFFSSDEIQFAVVHGDITVDEYSSTDNIILKINDIIDKVKKRYGYNNDDFLQIIHIVDTDGTFIKESVVEADVESVKYFIDRIETKNPFYLKKRNEKKAALLFKLYSSGRVNGIRYRIFYNSCNLEHILFEELKDFTDEEKEEMSDDFAEKYLGKLDDFIEFISDKSIAAEGNYKQTWKFIEKSKNSLNRYTNLHLIFQKNHK